MLNRVLTSKGTAEKSFLQKGFVKEAVIYRTNFRLLFLCIVLGIFAGSFLAARVDMCEKKMYIPMFFSGVPALHSHFFAVFSTLLLNSFTALLALFLAGITAFGTVAVPVLVFFKGFAVGVAAVSFLYKEANGFWQSAFTYMPVMAAASTLLIVFAVYALSFSKAFAKTFFSAEPVAVPDFAVYLKTFFLFLSLLVLVNFMGSFFTLLYSTFFQAGG